MCDEVIAEVWVSALSPVRVALWSFRFLAVVFLQLGYFLQGVTQVLQEGSSKVTGM